LCNYQHIQNTEKFIKTRKVMVTFYNLDYRRGGKNPKVSLVKTAVTQLVSIFSRGPHSCEHPTDQERMRQRDRTTFFLVLCPLILSLGLAAVPTVTLAGEENKEVQRGIDPTGVWLNRKQVILLTFHSDGTYLADISGEDATIPGNDNPGFQLTTPTHALWQKTGPRTLKATAFALQYYNDNGNLYAIEKGTLTGLLSESGDQMDITLSGGLFDLNGKLISSIASGTGHFERLHIEKP
jgi:hypothetical protein